MALDPVAVSGVIAGLGAVGWTIWRDRREKRKTQEHGLADNPERCAQHEVRIKQIEDQLHRIEGQNREDHAEIFGKIGDIAVQVGNLCGKLNGIGK